MIGHVNHGKSALVRALTGIETDRLPEERERGLSITLGYAWRDYTTGCVDFVDAPGHEDYIRAMVMGTTGAAAALLVVSAAEAFQRQTREHLRIADLLGLRKGVVAVTKADLLPEGAWPALRASIAGELAGSFLAGAPLALCSSVTGAGLEALHVELQALVSQSPPAGPSPGAFLPLDRVFSISGAGTVATGTLQGGSLAAGEEAVLEPSGRRVTLRQVQVHGQAAAIAPPGGRVAVGLRGVSADEVRPGEVLCATGAFERSLLVDVAISLAPDVARPLRSGDEVRVMWGARQDIGRLRIVGPNPLSPGEPALAQLRFAAPVIAYAGQRALLRRLSPAQTLGGAVVLDPVAQRLRGRTDSRRALLEALLLQDPDRIAAGLAQRDGGVLSLAEAARLARRPIEDVRRRLSSAFTDLGDSRMAANAAVAAACQAYLEHLAKAHRRAPARSWLSLGAIRTDVARSTPQDLVAPAEARLAALGEIELEGGQVRLRDHDPFAALSPVALERLGDIESAFRIGGVKPPDPGAITDPEAGDSGLVGLLIESGRLVSLRNHALKQTLVFHVEALGAALDVLSAAFPSPAEFTTGEARAALGTSRKFIVPTLEYFDAIGATVRRGDVRRLADAQNRFGLSSSST